MTPFALLFFINGIAAAGTPASVVTSKEWKASRNPRVDEFSGDVRYKSGPTLMTADWARYEHETGKWAAKGKVHVERVLKDGATMVADGERAAYDEKAKSGQMFPKDGKLLAFERRVADGEPDYGEGRRLDWRGESDGELTGEVRVWGPRYRAWGDKADLDGKLITLEGGRPVLERLQGKDWVGALKADAVKAEKTTQKMEADGAVTGWLRWFKKK